MYENFPIVAKTTNYLNISKAGQLLLEYFATQAAYEGVRKTTAT
jgi:hypothetical protein